MIQPGLPVMVTPAFYCTRLRTEKNRPIEEARFALTQSAALRRIRKSNSHRRMQENPIMNALASSSTAPTGTRRIAMPGSSLKCHRPASRNPTGKRTTAPRNPSEVIRPNRIKSRRAQIAAAMSTRLSNVPCACARRNMSRRTESSSKAGVRKPIKPSIKSPKTIQAAREIQPWQIIPVHFGDSELDRIFCRSAIGCNL